MGRGMPGRKEGFPGCEQKERDGNTAFFGGSEPPEQMSSQAVGNPHAGMVGCSESPGASSELCCFKYKDFREGI